MLITDRARLLPPASFDAQSDERHAPRAQAFANLSETRHVDHTLLHMPQVLELAIERPGEANLHFLDHIFAEIRAYVAESYEGVKRPARSFRGTLAPHLERRIKAQLRERLADPPSLQELAASCGLSRGHFSRAFKQTTGLPPHRWLVAERIKRARELLLQTQAPISDISFQCGFADQSQLTRTFTRSVGLSPAAWRRQMRR